MARRTVFTLLAITLVMAVLACQVSINPAGYEVVSGAGNVATEERPIRGVQRVAVNNQGNVIIQLGDQEKLVIEAEENLLPYLTSDVQGGELQLGTQANVNLRNNQPIRYYLTVKSLEGLTINSSGNINAPELQAKKFEIEVNSSGNTIVEALIADQLSLKIHSSGNVTILAGEIDKQNIDITSSGEYYAQNVQTKRADIRVSSSGNANIRVSDSLDATLSSSGNVRYVGNPQLDVNQTSSGKVVKIGN
jgi:hypothetical protein